MQVFTQHIVQILLKELIQFNKYKIYSSIFHVNKQLCIEYSEITNKIYTAENTNSSNVSVTNVRCLYLTHCSNRVFRMSTAAATLNQSLL